MAGRHMLLSDAWFELSGDGCRLMIATAQPGTALELDVLMADGGPIRFRHVADIRGRRVYEATWSRPADAQDPASPDQMLQLSGPSRGVPNHVA